MMLFIAILLAVAIAAPLFVTFLKIRRDKRFVEDTRIAMLCTPQGVRQGEARVPHLVREQGTLSGPDRVQHGLLGE